MNIFTIENDTNNITAYASYEAATRNENAMIFDSQATPAEMAAAWPTGRLIEIWNGLPGVAQVKKFTDRETAVRRIWGALQDLGEPAPAATLADAAQTTSDVAPSATVAGEEAAKEEEANVTRHPAKPRENKTDAVLAHASG